MPKALAERSPADVIGAAVMVGRIAVGDEPDTADEIKGSPPRGR